MAKDEKLPLIRIKTYAGEECSKALVKAILAITYNAAEMARSEHECNIHGHKEFCKVKEKALASLTLNSARLQDIIRKCIYEE